MAKTLQQKINELKQEDRRLSRRISEKRESYKNIKMDLDHHLKRRNDVMTTIRYYEDIIKKYKPDQYFKEDN